MWTAVTWHDEKNKRGRNVSDKRISRAPRASCWSKSEGPTLSSQIACAPCSYGPTSRVLVALRHVSLWPYVPRPCGPTSRVPVALRPVSRRPMFLWPSVTCPYGLTSRVPVAVRPVQWTHRGLTSFQRECGERGHRWAHLFETKRGDRPSLGTQVGLAASLWTQVRERDMTVEESIGA